MCYCTTCIFLTGTWYDGDVKSFGSLGFLFNYAILTGLFLMITKFITNLCLVAFLFILGYAILCIVESKLFGEKIYLRVSMIDTNSF